MSNLTGERGDWLANIVGLHVVKLGGFTLPGYVKLTGLEMADKFDVKEAKGTDGAYVTSQGYTPAPFKIELKIHRKTDYEAWNKIADKIRPRARKEGPTSWNIENILTLRRGIKKVFIDKISESTDNQIHVVTIDLREWFKPPKTITANKINDQSNHIDGTTGLPTKYGAVQNLFAIATQRAKERKP